MKSSPLVLLLLVGQLGCGTGGGAGKVPAPAGSGAGSPAEDLAAARRAFVTKLRVRGPAPQEYTPMQPPPGVQEVTYPSGDLRLKGWLHAGGGTGARRPAIVF